MKPLPSTHESPDCATVRDAVQSMLDGERLPFRESLDSHIQTCPACRGLVRSAERLQLGLTQMPRIVVPSSLTARIVESVKRDQREQLRQRFNRRFAGAVGIAASLLLVVFFWKPWASEGKLPLIVYVPQMEQAPKPSIRDRLNEARTAVVSLTSRAADQTVSILPMPTEIPNILSTTERPSTLEDASVSLDEAASGASIAFEPMTNAAERAFSFFERKFAPPTMKPDF